jgi:hypothetical protein
MMLRKEVPPASLTAAAAPAAAAAAAVHDADFTLMSLLPRHHCFDDEDDDDDDGEGKSPKEKQQNSSKNGNNNNNNNNHRTTTNIVGGVTNRLLSLLVVVGVGSAPRRRRRRIGSDRNIPNRQQLRQQRQLLPAIKNCDSKVPPLASRAALPCLVILCLVILYNGCCGSSGSVVTTTVDNADASAWTAYVDDYTRRFHRRPPNGLRAWHEFAVSNQCLTDHRYYEYLHHDMNVFRRNEGNYDHDDDHDGGGGGGNYYEDRRNDDEDEDETKEYDGRRSPPPAQPQRQPQPQEQPRLLSWDQVIPRGKPYTDHYVAYRLDNHRLQVVDEDFHREANHRSAILRLLRKLLDPVLKHQPPLTSTLFFNLLDVATSDDVHDDTSGGGGGDGVEEDEDEEGGRHRGDTKPKPLDRVKKYPIFSVCKMDYYTDNRRTPTTTSSDAAAGEAKARNDASLPPPPGSVLGDGGGDGGRGYNEHHDYHRKNNNNNNVADFVRSSDLLVPWHFSLRWQSVNLWWWPFYGSGIPYRYRYESITWRGSTTSPWETGPRFQLVRRYGGTNVHPLVVDGGKHEPSNIRNDAGDDRIKSNHHSSFVPNDPTNTAGTTTTRTTTATTTPTNSKTTAVNADFAFIKVVQKPDHVDALSPGYRFARHQFYWEMQLRKYIMDVDGNGALLRCCDDVRVLGVL